MHTEEERKRGQQEGVNLGENGEIKELDVSVKPKKGDVESIMRVR